MKTVKNLLSWSTVTACGVVTALLIGGCDTMHKGHDMAGMDHSAKAPGSAMPPTPAVAAPTPATPKVAASPMAARPTIRIKAGSTEAFKDAAGNTWAPDTGFDNTDVVDRGSTVPIAGSKDPDMFRTEHYGMTSFTQALPNGKYVVKLYFAETYSEISAPGQRVFSFSVNGTDVKDFDIFKEAGGDHKMIVKTIPVEVKDGKLTITFTPGVQMPAVNAIEITPA